MAYAVISHIWKILESLQEFRVIHIWCEGNQAVDKLAAGDLLVILEDSICYSPSPTVLPTTL